MPRAARVEPHPDPRRPASPAPGQAARPARHRIGATLLRNFLRAFALPTLFASFVFTLIALTEDLLAWTDLVVRRGLGADTVAWLAGYQALPELCRTLPFAVLVGTLGGLGRMASQRELLALEVGGVSPRELLRPVLVFVALMTALGLPLSLAGAPASLRAGQDLLAEIARQRPGVAVQVGRVERFGSWKLEAREVSGHGDRVRGVLLWIPDVGETVFAERGSLEPTPDGATELRLENGTVFLHPRKGGAAIRFEQMTTRLPETGGPITLEGVDPLSTLGLRDLRARSAGEPSDREARLARMELQRRFALPCATFLLGALAVPLLLLRGPRSGAAGAILGILVTVGYYGLVQIADGLIQSRSVGVSAGVWLPNGVLAALTLALLPRLSRLTAYGRPRERRPGGRGARPHWRPGAGPEPLRMRRWILERYVARRFAQTLLLCFVTLLVGYFLIDLLERLDFFARYAASPGEVVRYYGARLPVLTTRIVPMTLLLAAALTVSLFGAENELLGMLACGIPAPRAMLPVLVLSAVIAPLYFVLNDQVVPRATALWHHVKNVEIRDVGEQPARPEPVWYRLGDHLYEAAEIDPGLGTARDVAIYALDPHGLPTSRTDAREAHYIGSGVWRLVEPVRYELRDGELVERPARRFAEFGRDVTAEVDTRELSLAALAHEIRVVQESGYDATPYRVDYYAKLAAPLACLVLPALALFFAVGGQPPPGPAQTLVFSVIVAVAWVLASGVGSSLGYAGSLPPAAAGLGPACLFAALAAALGLRVRGFGGGA